MKSGAVLLTAALLAPVTSLHAQGGDSAQSSPFRRALRAASRLDTEGKSAEAQIAFQRLIDEAPDPASKAAAQRRMAMSYAFLGDCASTVKYEEMVIAYWVTREQAEPQEAFYQQGEMANEAARVCIDAGHLDEAERMYRRGSDLGNAEPEPRTHPRSLWDFRLAHALARIAAECAIPGSRTPRRCGERSSSPPTGASPSEPTPLPPRRGALRRRCVARRREPRSHRRSG